MEWSCQFGECCSGDEMVKEEASLSCAELKERSRVILSLISNLDGVESSLFARFVLLLVAGDIAWSLQRDEPSQTVLYFPSNFVR